jgi:hypothetical protein
MKSMTTQSQCGSILARLQEANGARVSLPDLHAVSGALAVATRISNLRTLGYDIQNECKNGHSFYWLVASKEVAA